MKEHDELTRAHAAQQLLDNAALTEALDAIEREVVMQWGDCPARDKEGKEALWQLFKTSQKFRALLLGYVQTGKLAAENLRRHEEARGLKAMLRRIA